MIFGIWDFPAKYNIINSHSQVMKYLGLLHQIIVNHLRIYCGIYARRTYIGKCMCFGSIFIACFPDF